VDGDEHCGDSEGHAVILRTPTRHVLLRSCLVPGPVRPSGRGVRAPRQTRDGPRRGLSTRDRESARLEASSGSARRRQVRMQD
jgi:hypothetical protein